MVDAVGKTRRGRGNRQKARLLVTDDMLPTLKRGLPVTEPMSQEQVEKIHNASMGILEEVGVIFRDAVALEQWKAIGAKVEGDRVYLDREMVMELVSTIPENIKLNARNPAKSVDLGGNNSIFVPMTGAPFIADLENKRRWPTLEDLGDFHKLAHMSPAIHSSAHHIVEPMDHPVAHRHLRITYSSMKHSDKTFMGII